MRKTFFATALTLCASSALAASFPSPPLYPSFASPKPAITTFAVKGTTLDTVVGINAKGEIAGEYADSKGAIHGFIRKRDGSFTKFEDPHATLSSGIGTLVTAIDTNGDVTGTYTSGASEAHGFLRQAGGTFVEFDAPNATITEPLAMNATEITGVASGNKKEVAFVRDASGNFTIFSVNNKETLPTAIGTDGTIVGEYGDSKGGIHGFRRNPAGKIVKFDPPNSGLTLVAAINKNGLIVGSYLDAKDVVHGYIRATDGTITTFDSPGSQGTEILGVDQAGDVLGAYLASDNLAHGFLRKASGKVDKFVVTINGVAQETIAKSINDTGAITGEYLDSSDNTYGFVRAP